MAVIEGGTSAALQEVGAAAQKGGHVIQKPDDAGALGHYVAHLFTGNMAANAGALSELAQFRYTGTNQIVVYSVTLEHFRSLATAFVAGNYLFDVIKSITWTVDGSGGVTQVPEKVRTSFAAPTATCRVATTAPLGAGTKTLATQPLRAIRGIISVAINGMQLGSIAATANVTVGYPGPVPLLTVTGDYPGAAHPLHLIQNEGFSIRATVPGTGVWEAAFTIRFAELTAY